MDASFLQALLPADASVRIAALAVEPTAVVVALVTTGVAAVCPGCGSLSATVHGRYHRTLRDRPCLGVPVSFAVTVRKFVCRRPDCSRRVFCERLPDLTTPHAHTTGKLADAHRHLGLALGDEAGARLAVELGLPTSPDTILRRVKDAPEEPAPRPRYVGVDDWATCKGHSYGTILIDLERGTVIDLLPGRDGEALKAWLSANPQVEVITRDRWPADVQAATAAAPQGKQVADRFHLLRNVREAVEKILSRVGSDIRAANAEPNDPTPPAPNGPTADRPVSSASTTENPGSPTTPEPEGAPRPRRTNGARRNGACGTSDSARSRSCWRTGIRVGRWPADRGWTSRSSSGTGGWIAARTGAPVARPRPPSTRSRRSSRRGWRPGIVTEQLLC